MNRAFRGIETVRLKRRRGMQHDRKFVISVLFEKRSQQVARGGGFTDFNLYQRPRGNHPRVVGVPPIEHFQ
jgi:hypothetical protein